MLWKTLRNRDQMKDFSTPPVLNDSVIGITVDQTFRYTWRDIALYNISVGAKPSDISYVYEKGIKVIPTFAVVPCTGVFGVEPPVEYPDMPYAHVEGLRTDGMIQMDHKLIIRKPLPAEGVFRIRKRLDAFYDRGPGRGTKIIATVTGFGENGEEWFVNEVGVLNLWVDGFGGEPTPGAAFRMPSRDPDHRIDGSFPPNAAVLYRLTGDLNPIHVSTEAAASAHMEQPVLQGLCSMGNACRLIIDTLFPGEPERVRSMENQFRAAVTPGEEYCLQIWEDGQTAYYRMIAGNDGRSIIDYGKMTWE